MKYLLLLFAMSIVPLSRASNIVFSGLRNLSIPQSDAGIYLNPFSGATASSQPADWDTAPYINPFFGGIAIGNDAKLQPVIIGSDNSGSDQIADLSFGTSIGVGSDFATAGSDSGSDTHTGSGPNLFPIGTPGYIGFALEEGASTYYGWMQIDINNTGAGTIVDWAYDSTPNESIKAGSVPDSGSTIGLLGVALVGVFVVRTYGMRRLA